MQKPDQATLELLISQSLEQYGEIYDLLKMHGSNINSQLSDGIIKFDETLGGLQNLAQQTDRHLADQLKIMEFSETMEDQLSCRTELQEKVLVLLKETANRANNVKSLLASEMQSIRQGRKALTGYKTNSDYQGRIIDKTS